MTSPPVHRATASVSLLAVLAATVVTLTAGALMKSPCASGSWADGRQYRRLCYSDIVPLYGTEHLQGGRLPYFDRCPDTGGQQNCDEYPVLTMYFMRLAAWMSDSYGGFFWANAVMLSLLALVTVVFLFALVGERALYFAVAPTLMIYAFVNWDLLAVALAAAATWAFLRNRDSLSGTLIGLGAAAKLYPALLLVPFALDRWRARRAGGAISVLSWAGIAYGVVNLPFALFSHSSWLTFFRFNRDRVADFDSLWYITCQRLHLGCSLSPAWINVLSVVCLAGAAAAAWFLRRMRDPGFARWTFAFPLLVTFLLSNKVYSPQYGLWLLPWFPLALPDIRLFVLFEAADVAVFVTRFSWFGRFQLGVGGAPLGAFQLAVVLRAVVLLACLVAWVLRRGEEVAVTEVPNRQPAGSTEALGTA